MSESEMKRLKVQSEAMEKNLMQVQCWICPVCFDDHKRPYNNVPNCQLSDLVELRNSHESLQRQLEVKTNDYNDAIKMISELRKDEIEKLGGEK